MKLTGNGENEAMTDPSLSEASKFVFEQAKANIERVKDDPGFVPQAKQVNSSLAAIAAMARNHVMNKALSRPGRYVGPSLPGDAPSDTDQL